MTTTAFADLSPEIILHVMECLPDVATLKSVVLSNRRFYDIFKTHTGGAVLLSVLNNELGEDVFVHAVVAHQVEKMEVVLPPFDELSMDHIDVEVANLRKMRDQAVILQQSSPRHSSIQITVQDAERISLLGKRISQLSAAFVEDCSCGQSLRFYPLQDSIRRRPVSDAELSRVRHSMYMYHILCVFCSNLFLDIRVNQRNETDQRRVAACVRKITRLQSSLVTRFMAPWELYQVISLQAWFRRAMHDLESDCYLSERLMPYILSQGIDCMHQGICIVGEEKGLRRFVDTLKQEASLRPAHAFGMIISRGERDSWARKVPKDFDNYSPFWSRRDEGGYRSWCHLETPNGVTLGFDSAAPAAYDILGITDGMLDIWSAALWDPIRWFEIRRSMKDRMYPDPWDRIMWHWDSFHVGWRSALDPEMSSGVRSEARIKTFIRWIKVMLRYD